MTTETDRPPVEDVIKDMGDDALAETALEIRAEGKRLLDLADHAEFELVNRMVAREATKLDTEHWTGALTPGLPTYVLNDEKMMELREACYSHRGERQRSACRISRMAQELNHHVPSLRQHAHAYGAVRRALHDSAGC